MTARLSHAPGRRESPNPSAEELATMYLRAAVEAYRRFGAEAIAARLAARIA